MAFFNNQFAVGTAAPVLIYSPLSSATVLVQVLSGGGTVILGGSNSAGGIQLTTASGLVQVPVRNFGGAANADDGLYAHTTLGGSVNIGVLGAT